MHSEYIDLIAQIDRVLSMIREFWLAANHPGEIAKWRDRLDQSLDERLRLMRLRDASLPRAA